MVIKTGIHAWPTYANASPPTAHSRFSVFTALCRLLLDPKAQQNAIERILKTEDFNEIQHHQLFAHIRQAVIDMLFEHREFELWIFRAGRLGTTYANANTIENSVAKFSGKHNFQRKQDELLEMTNGGSEELKAMILQHVGVLREGVVRLSELKTKKAEMLKAHTVGKTKL